MTTDSESIIVLDDNTQARLDLWERMAKAILRSYAKLPMAKHNEKLNAELSELVDLCRDLEPSLQKFYAMD